MGANRKKQRGNMKRNLAPTWAFGSQPLGSGSKLIRQLLGDDYPNHPAVFFFVFYVKKTLLVFTVVVWRPLTARCQSLGFLQEMKDLDFKPGVESQVSGDWKFCRKKTDNKADLISKNGRFCGGEWTGSPKNIQKQLHCSNKTLKAYNQRHTTATKPRLKL